MWSGADRFLLLFVMQHGTGHGFGSFLTVHEGPQSFSSSVPLVAGHVITNEPGFCKSPVFSSPYEDMRLISGLRQIMRVNGA